MTAASFVKTQSNPFLYITTLTAGYRICVPLASLTAVPALTSTGRQVGGARTARVNTYQVVHGTTEKIATVACKQQLRK